MTAADAIGIWQFSRTATPGQRLTEADQNSLSVARVHLDVDTFRDNLAELASTHDIRQFTTKAALLRQKFGEDIAHAQQLLGSSIDTRQDPAIRSALETLRVTLPSQLDAAIELASVGDWLALSLRVRDQAQALILLSSSLVEKVDREISRQRVEAIESAERARRQLVAVMPVSALLTLLIAVALGWYATRSITHPLSQLQAGAQALAKGDFQHQVAIRGQDELAQLGQVFNDTAGRLSALYDTLRTNEARLRLTIDTVPAYVWSARPDGLVDFINQPWLEFSGLSLEQGLGWGWEAAVHPEDRAHFLKTWREAVGTGKSMEAEARVRRADGQYRWLLIRNVPLRDEAGTIVKWYGTSTDIDDWKQAEQALKESEAYLAEAQRLSHTGSWAFHLASNKYIYASEECLRIFEIDAQQNLPAREAVFRRIHPEDWDRVNASFEKSLREKVDASAEFRIALPSGTTKHVRVVCHPVLNYAGEVIKIVGSVIDITERKRAEEEHERLRRLEADLRHLNRVSMMGELAASIAHEVNQPISGVVSNGSACLRWLARDVPGLEEAREAARRIVRDGKRAGDVIARIRALTIRSETAREKLDLNEIIREVLALVGDEAKRSRVIIRTAFAYDLPLVLGDRVQLQQVAQNLVMNAMEAMSNVNDRARELAITTRTIDADQVLVSVEDSGPGINPQVIDKIFNSFYTTKPGGMGMGLSISRSIIQTHGGRLWATAKDGTGAVFHFALPKYYDDGSNA